MLDRPGLPPDESYREITEAWLAAFRTALERRSAAALSWLFVADSHWRNLFGLSWQFCDLQRPADGCGRTADACGRGSGAPVSASIRRGSRRASRGRRARGGRSDHRFRDRQRPGLWRCPAAARGGRRAQRLDDLDLARFRCHLRARARPRRRHPTSAILPARTGSSSGRRRPLRRSRPRCARSSAAAMPAFRRRSKSGASACRRWWSTARRGSATIGGCAIAG